MYDRSFTRDGENEGIVYVITRDGEDVLYGQSIYKRW